MDKFCIIGFAVLFVLFITVFYKIYELKNIEYHQPELLTNKRILTVHYSNNGNTKYVAENIHFLAGGDIKEIELTEKYPNNIFEMSILIRKQAKDGFLPKINDVDISDYDIIFVGSPVWNFSMSLPMRAFLKNNNFENKTLIPFFTYSGGARRKKIINEIKTITNAKDIKKPLFMFENGIYLTRDQIIKWLNNI